MKTRLIASLVGHPFLDRRCTHFSGARVLVTFYCNKLDDADTIKPALTGLLCLAKLPSFSPVEATAALEASVKSRI